jgi:alpha-glucosidase
LPEADVPYEALRDPYGIAFWPMFKGRDGCRTPMPWSDDTQGGFSAVAPWLPVPGAHRQRAVSRQEADPDSPLNSFRRFLRWRCRHPALRWGEIQLFDLPEPLLAFVRRMAGETLFVAFNLGADAVEVPLPLPQATVLRALDGHGLPAGRVADGILHLPAYGAVFARID